jgi:N-methylhydantoinase A/oxoprolinase/acetone carboxylase beta subunit
MAAYRIVTKATDMIAKEVTELIKRTGRSPSEFVLFAFGGNGAMVGCEVAKKADLKRVYAFSLGSVFSAFGSSVADISHNYEYSPMMAMSEKKALADMVQWMIEEARRDMEGEGFGASNVDFELEMLLRKRNETKSPVSVVSPLKPTSDPGGTAGARLEDWMKGSGLASESADLFVEVMRLRAKVPAPKFLPPQFGKAEETPGDAYKGERVVSRGSERIPVKVYDWDKLRTGNRIQGPSIIEGSDVTYILPRGWQLTMDSFQNAVLDRRI